MEPIISSTKCLEEQLSPLRTNVTNEAEYNSLSKAAHQYLIRGLLERLPSVDTAWPIDARVRWLKALAVNLAVIYGPEDEGEIEIKAPVKSPASQPSRPSSLPPHKTISATPMLSTNPKPDNSGVPQGSDLDDEIPF